MDNSLEPSNVRDQLLGQLMDTYGTSILRTCMMYLKDASMAEDAAQDTFIKAFRKIDYFLDNSIESEKAWLMRIAINTCKDYHRSGWFRHIDRQIDPSDVVRFSELSSDDELSLLQEITDLPRKLKEVVLLFYYQGFRATEIAEALNVSEVTVYDRLKRAQNKLRLALEREVSICGKTKISGN